MPRHDVPDLPRHGKSLINSEVAFGCYGEFGVVNFFDIVKAAVEGVVQIPVDLYYAGRRAVEDSGALGEEAQRNNRAEYDRVGDLILAAVRDRRALTQMIEIIVTDFADQLPQEAQDRLQDKLALAGVKFAAKQGGKQVLAAGIAEFIAAQVVTKFVTKRVVKVGVGLAISGALLYGMVERASNASLRLKRINPRLHQKLVVRKLDMIYFMVEEPMAPFVSADALRTRNPAAYEAMINDMIEKMN